MKTNFISAPLPRRTFLRGAACTLGAAAWLIETPPPSAAAAPALAALGFWDGTRLVPAGRLPSGDPALCRRGVTLTMRGFGGDGRRTLRALDVYSPVAQGADTLWTPFHAWTSPPDGHAVTRCVLPVHERAGLRLLVHHGAQTPLALSVGTETSAAKLRPGHYVLTAHALPTWAAYHFAAAEMETPGGPLRCRTLAGFVPPAFDYAVLSVAPA